MMHTSTSSFKADAQTAQRIRELKPDICIGFIGAAVAVEPEKSLIAALAVDFVARNEFDFTVKEVADGRTQQDTQIAPLSYPHLSLGEIFDSVEAFYSKFCLRPWKIASMIAEMIASPAMMKRRVREGVEFFHFLRSRRDAA